jgi:hypothetical protein
MALASLKRSVKLLSLAALAAGLGFALLQPVPAKAQLEELKQRIVRMCGDAWGDYPDREQQCRADNLKLLQDYISLINSYPKQSQQYKVLLECSQQWPDDIPMWKMCANLAMPDERAFRPFDTGPTPVEIIQQYQAAQPSPFQPPDPRKMPPALRALQSGGGLGAGTTVQGASGVTTGSPNTRPLSNVGGGRPVQPSNIVPPSSIQAPATTQTQQPVAPPPVQQPAATGVYVPGQGVKRNN